MNTAEVREILTTKQVAEEYGINEGTLRYWRHCDLGPASFARAVSGSFTAAARLRSGSPRRKQRQPAGVWLDRDHRCNIHRSDR